jgi:hypothetical protein
MSGRPGRSERAWAVAILLVLAALGLLPLARPRDDVLNFVFLTLLAMTLAQSWNVVAGYAGQVNLGHAAFFGLGALVARTLWIRGTPIALGMLAGTAVAVAVALIIGTVELLGLLADKMDLHGVFWNWVAGLDLNTVGFVIVGLFFATWAIALAVWKMGRIEEKWTAGLSPRTAEQTEG